MTNLKVVIGIIAVVLAFAAYIPYLRDTLASRTKPHVYTWFVWGLAAMVIFALQFSEGGGPGAWVTFAVASLSITVFVLGFRVGDKDITWLDTGFLILALVALGLWLLADQPVLSMILLVATELLGFGPTVRKSWHQPYSETLSTYAINVVRHALSVFALTEYTIVTWLFPVSWTIANVLFVIFLLSRRRLVPAPTTHQASQLDLPT
ncbi:MAG: hypothetical protein HKM24_00120 [Gammaproteobacteria bacterium]|nr:hypothetical protein [Gammaproteobacteria bacterium]